MNKLLTVLLVVLMVPFALAADLSAGPGMMDFDFVNHGEFKTAELTFGNSGQNDLSVNLASRSVSFVSPSKTQSITVSFNQSSLRVAPNDSPKARYSFTVPVNMFSAEYQGTMTLTDNASNSVIHLINFTVNADPGLTLVVPSAAITAGQSGTSNVIVTNAGNTDLSVSFTANDLVNTADSSKTIAASNIQVPGTFSLLYSTQSTKTFTITVPSSTQSGTYRGLITATAGSLSVSQTLEVVVQSPTFTFSMSPSPLEFGDVSQNDSLSKTFTITNTGNSPLTNFVINSSAQSRFSVAVNPSTFSSLAAGASRTVTVTAVIPNDESSGLLTLGTLTIKPNEAALQSLTLKANIKGQLEVEDIDVFVDDKRKSVSCGDTVDEDAKPGDEIRVEIKLSNEFPSSSDIDINDITIEGTLRDVDDGDDLDDEVDEFDIDAGKSSSTQTLTFTVPLVVEEGTYDLDLEIEGQDDNDVTHRVDCQLKIDVEKENYDLIIDKISLVPDTLGCMREAKLNLKIVNIGSRDEDEARIEIRHSALGLNIDERELELDEGDEDDSVLDRSYDISLASNFKAGTYPIVAKIYRDTNILEDSESVTLKVEACGSSQPTEPADEEEEEEEVVVEKVNDQQKPQTQQPKVAETTTATRENPFTKQPSYTMMLIAANALLLVLLIMGLVWLFKRR